MQNTTNLAACNAIIETFKKLRRLYEYLVTYAEDHRRVTIDNAGYVTINYFQTKTLTKSTKIVKIQFDGRRLLSKEELKAEKRIVSDVIDVKAENAFLTETLVKLER
jgi:hypothetical protein